MSWPWLGESGSASHVYTVPLSGGRSPYDRYGDWVVQLSVALLVLAAGYLGVRAARVRTAGRNAPAPR